jgi:hypothetical protein
MTIQNVLLVGLVTVVIMNLLPLVFVGVTVFVQVKVLGFSGYFGQLHK